MVFGSKEMEVGVCIVGVGRYADRMDNGSTMDWRLGR